MSVYSDMMADAGLPMLMDGVGESLTVYPDGVTARVVNGFVERNPPEPLDGADALSPRLVITLANNATTGMTASEVNTGLSTVSIAAKPGGSATTRPIVSIIDQDAALIRVGVR